MFKLFFSSLFYFLLFPFDGVIYPQAIDNIIRVKFFIDIISGIIVTEEKGHFPFRRGLVSNARCDSYLIVELFGANQVPEKFGTDRDVKTLSVLPYFSMEFKGYPAS
jgi:hypothetical protein